MSQQQENGFIFVGLFIDIFIELLVLVSSGLEAQYAYIDLKDLENISLD